MTILSNTKFSLGDFVLYHGKKCKVLETNTETVIMSDGTIRERQETYKIKDGKKVTNVDVGALKEVTG